jgi:hypothetical protein
MAFFLRVRIGVISIAISGDEGIGLIRVLETLIGVARIFLDARASVRTGISLSISFLPLLSNRIRDWLLENAIREYKFGLKRRFIGFSIKGGSSAKRLDIRPEAMWNLNSLKF